MSDSQICPRCNITETDSADGICNDCAGEEHVANIKAFVLFCECNPHEAYESDPEMFMQVARSKNPEVTKEEIERWMNETR